MLLRKIVSRWLKAREKAPYLYPDADAEDMPVEVQDAIQRFRELPEKERAGRPLLWWLLGKKGTPPYKKSKIEAAYAPESPYEQTCENCIHAYQHVVTGVLICDQMRGAIQPAAWCQLWDPPGDKTEYAEYQELKPPQE